MIWRMMKGVVMLLYVVGMAGVAEADNKIEAGKPNSVPIKAETEPPFGIFVQLGHSGGVQTLTFQGHSLKFSPDGKILVSGGMDGLVKIWDMDSGKELRTLEGGGYEAVAVSTDSKTIAASTGKGIKLWNIESGRAIREFKGLEGRVKLLEFSLDGRTLYSFTAGDYYEIRQWDVETGKLIRTIQKKDYRSLELVALSPDFRTFATVTPYDEVIKIWNMETGKELRTLRGHKSSIGSLSYSTDGATLISAGNFDKTIKLWNVDTGAEIISINGDGHSNVAISPNGKIVVGVEGYGEGSHLWDSADGRELGEGGSGYVFCFSPDSKYLAFGDEGGGIKITEIGTGKVTKRLGGDQSTYTSIAVSPNSQLMATKDLQEISIWDLANGRKLRSATCKDWSEVTYSPDGRFLGAGCKDSSGGFKLWGADSGNELSVSLKSEGAAHQVYFFPDGKSFTTLEPYSIEVAIRDISDGKVLRMLPIFGKGANNSSPAVSPDGKLIATIIGHEKREIKLWDVANGSLVRSFEVKNYRGWYSYVAFSPDGQLLATYGDNARSEIWDVKKGSLLLKNPYTSKALAFSPDGKMLALEGFPNQIRLIDTKSFKVISYIRGHRGEVRAVAFSGDGKSVISGGYDGTVRKWDVATGKEIAQFDSFKDGEWITVTPEGYYDASPHGDKHLNVRVGNKVFGIENYREKFYRPDLVQMALSGQALPTELAGGMNKVGIAPAVTLANLPGTVNSDSLDLQVKVQDQGGGIGDVRVYINGTAVQGQAARALKLIKNGVDAGNTLSIPVNLVSGENKIKVLVFNAENSMSSNPAEATVMSSFKVQRKPQLHALIVGIQEFENPSLNLQFTKGDAEAVKQSLEKQASGLFERVNVQLLTSKPETTKSAIAAAFAKYKATIAPDDVFLFYVASHGTVDGESLADKSYYLITSNVGSTATKNIKKDALSQDELRRLIADIPATKKLVLLDTCHAGDVGSKLLGRGLDEDSAVKLLSRSTGIAVIAASTSTQQALEGHHGHGVFTYVLLEGLAGKADAAKKGYVTPVSLADYVTEQVPDVTEKVFKSKQYPTFNVEGQPFPIVRSTWSK